MTFTHTALLLLVALLGGCADQPAASQASCCRAPAPGSMVVNLNGRMVTEFGLGH